MSKRPHKVIYPKWDFVAKFECAGPTKVWWVFSHICEEEGYISPSFLLKRSKDMWVVMLRCKQNGHPRIAFFSSTSVSYACLKAERALLERSVQWRTDKFSK